MSTAWQLQEAKNRFSEVVDEALQNGPQTVTRRGEPVVVVVAIDTWRRMVEPPPSLKAWLRQAPLDGLDLLREADERPDAELA
jgi:antitoxin Phd